MNCSGISLANRLIAPQPVQWLGMTKRGCIFFISSIVGPITDSIIGPVRWNPPRTAWTSEVPVTF